MTWRLLQDCGAMKIGSLLQDASGCFSRILLTLHPGEQGSFGLIHWWSNVDENCPSQPRRPKGYGPPPANSQDQRPYRHVPKSMKPCVCKVSWIVIYDSIIDNSYGDYCDLWFYDYMNGVNKSNCVCHNLWCLVATKTAGFKTWMLHWNFCCPDFCEFLGCRWGGQPWFSSHGQPWSAWSAPAIWPAMVGKEAALRRMEGDFPWIFDPKHPKTINYMSIWENVFHYLGKCLEDVGLSSCSTCLQFLMSHILYLPLKAPKLPAPFWSLHSTSPARTACPS